MNRTKLKRVKKSADAMLGALTESKLSSKADFKANLKTVKKEEEKVGPPSSITLLSSISLHTMNTSANISLSHRKRR